MPIQGFARLRKHQFARQAVLGTKVAATRAYGFSGTPDVNLSWTDPDVDVGSRDIVAPPYRLAPVIGGSLTSPMLTYNDLPLMLAAIFGGAEIPTPSGTAQTWHWTPASLTVDDPDLFTYEFGDDVLFDWYQLGDGLLTSLEVAGPEGLGPLTASMSWRFGSASSTGSTDSPVTGSVPTPGLNVDPAAAIVYLKDLGLYISSTYAGLAGGQVTDALHSLTLTVTQEVDDKRFANGSQKFDVSGYGPGARTIELACTFAKTADTVGLGSESDAWFSDSALNRYVELKATSTVEADSGIPYSWNTKLPMRYYTREEGDSNGNTTVVLTGKAFYDPSEMHGVFDSTVVCTLDEATLGDVPTGS